MMEYNFAEVLITSAIGSSGVMGIFFFIFRFYIEKKLKEREKKADEQISVKLERIRVNDRLTHCYGRLFFWIYKAIIDGHHNGDLDKAFKELQEVEEKKKELDRKILSEHIE